MTLLEQACAAIIADMPPGAFPELELPQVLAEILKALLTARRDQTPNRIREWARIAQRPFIGWLTGEWRRVVDEVRGIIAPMMPLADETRLRWTAEELADSITRVAGRASLGWVGGVQRDVVGGQGEVDEDVGRRRSEEHV